MNKVECRVFVMSSSTISCTLGGTSRASQPAQKLDEDLV